VTIRINKYLADRGIASRRRSDALIAEGRVAVNGRIVTEPGVQIGERDRVTVDGKPVGGRERHVYYVLNKPVGVITTLDDPEGRRSIREFLPRGARVYPVGRLDADTSGLLLLTNDGDLAHKLMHPRYGVPKVYRVRLAAEPRPDQLRRLSQGVRFDRERNLVSGPAKARRIDPGFAAIMIEVIIHEGRYRQVRRMCEAVGLEVIGLHRTGYGPLRLGPLSRGMFRELSEDEVTLLRRACARAGGSEERRATPAKRSAPATRPAPAPELDEDVEEVEDQWLAGGGALGEVMDDDEEEGMPGWPLRADGRRGDADFEAPARPRREPAARPVRRERPAAPTRPERAERPLRGQDRPRGRGDRPARAGRPAFRDERPARGGRPAFRDAGPRRSAAPERGGPRTGRPAFRDERPARGGRPAFRDAGPRRAAAPERGPRRAGAGGAMDRGPRRGSARPSGRTGRPTSGDGRRASRPAGRPASGGTRGPARSGRGPGRPGGGNPSRRGGRRP
jgi:pseudouridine synthase